MDDINSEFPECDVALVIGANDTTNPAARTGEGPLAGMPILDVDKARVVVIIKRSLSVGYAGVDNDLFYMDKTMMLFGDGKQMMNELNFGFEGVVNKGIPLGCVQATVMADSDRRGVTVRMRAALTKTAVCLVIRLLWQYQP